MADETAAQRFARDWSSQEAARKDKGWDNQDLERRERRYVDSATGLNAEGDGPYDGE